MRRPPLKIVVIDDDPTGSQTVHSCPLLLTWDVDCLRRGLRHSSPLLFVLANTRALPPGEAARRNRDIVDALAEALILEEIPEHSIVLVSRGDSTLRGHGVLEPEALAEAWSLRFGAIDATFHIPAFFEGGRITRDGVHFLGDQPVHTTVFARDQLFGFSTSDLAAWLEEKSAGCIRASSVLQLKIEQLEGERTDLVSWLAALDGNRSVVVDATQPEHLRSLGAAVRQLQGQKRFLFRSAASFLNGLADSGSEPLGPQPRDAKALTGLRRRDASGGGLPGLVVVGSHVVLADQQLEHLLLDPRCMGVELPVARVARILEGGTPDLLLPDLERELQGFIEAILWSGCTPVLFTSRGELHFGSSAAAAEQRLRFGMQLARVMARLVHAVVPQLGYVISKGGITTGTLLREGFALSSVDLQGQLLPGLSLVMAMVGADHPAARASALPVVTFPGNLGDPETLKQAWLLMENGL